MFYGLFFMLMPVASFMVLLQCQVNGKIIRTGTSTESMYNLQVILLLLAWDHLQMSLYLISQR